MTLRYFSALAVVVLMVSSCHVAAQPLYACSPTSPPLDAPTPIPDTLGHRVQQTAIIFEGAVTADRPITTVQVTRYLKGTGPPIVQVLGFGSGADCLPKADSGMHGLFFTLGDPYDQLSRQPWSGIEQANDTTVTSIIRLVSHEPQPPAAEGVSPPGRRNGIIALLTFGLLCACIGIFIWQERNRQRTRATQ